MVCSICFACDHNKRTCAFQLKAPIGIDLSLVPSEPTSPVKQTRKCSLCGKCGHNSRTCGVKQSIACQELALTFDAAIANFKPMKRKITCSICSENGHNSRTCLLKCAPCSDQVVRSYCFASMSAEKAVSMARIIECSSIYDEE